MSSKLCTDEELNVILHFIHEYFACPWIEPNDNLIQAIPLDSLRYIELIIFLEKRFGVKISDHFLKSKNMGTPVAIAEFIRLQKRNPA